MKKNRIGVLLAGCGVKDGSEIHEATLTLYFLDKQGAEIVCMAPNKDQLDVVNHITGAAASEKRNVLVEAARIARGNISDVKNVKADDIDEDVARLLKELHRSKKPIGALCIAPALIARLFGSELAPEITIGSDPGTASAMEKMGVRHKNARVDEIIVDSRNKIVTTPCYMLAQSIREVGAGAEKLVAKIMEMVG